MKGLRCRKGNYYGEFTDPEKIHPRKEYPLGTRDKTQAELIYARLQSSFAKGSFNPWKDKRPASLRLDDAVRAFLRTREDRRLYSANTHAGYKSTLEMFAASASAHTADRISTRDVERFLRKRSLGAPSEDQYLRRLIAFCNYLIAQGHLHTNPAKMVSDKLDRDNRKRRQEVKRRRDPFMPDELLRVLSCIYNEVPPEGERKERRTYIAAMAEVAACTGLDLSEIAAIRPDDVRLRRYETERGLLPLAGQIRLPRQKTRIDRVVPLPPRAALIFGEWMDKAKSERSGTVFFTPTHHRPPIANTVSREFSEYVEDAKLWTGTVPTGKLTFKSTRHSYVTWLLALGLPRHVVRDLAGHADAKMTDHYAHTIERLTRGFAREVAADILAFYCPGIERKEIERVVSGASGGSYAFGGGYLTDILFGAALYRETESSDAPAPKDMSADMFSR